MDVFYEESAAERNAAKSAKKYAVLNIFSTLFMVLAVIATVMFVFFIPDVGFMIFFGMFVLSFWLGWFLFYRWKNITNVSYDYVIVTDEIRISKVVNANKRRLLARFNGEAIIQMGDVDGTSFDRFAADPNVKKVICTSNDVPAEGKFFLYILAENDGKKLYVLECREELLSNILRFTKRTALDRDYVSQERKKQQS